MTDFNQVQDQLNLEEKDMKTLPQMLNVLTILTYIGSALQLCGGLFTYFTIGASYKVYENMGETGNAADNPFGKIMSAASETVKKQYENRTIIMILTVVCALACFYGAMQMRQRKMMGYNIYVAGELINPVVNMFLIGFGGFGAFGVIGLIFPILFVILYTTQRKYLTN
jgi:general stress protein CsbA